MLYPFVFMQFRLESRSALSWDCFSALSAIGGFMAYLITTIAPAPRALGTPPEDVARMAFEAKR